MRKIFLIIFILLAVTSSGCTEKPNSFGVFLDIDNQELLTKCENYETVVIDAEYYTKQEIEKLKEDGKKVFSYLNIGAIEDFRSYFSQFSHITISEYDGWQGEYWIDVSNLQWQQQVVNKTAKEYAQKGIDGFFIDNCDVYYIKSTDEIYNGVKNILEDLKNEYNLDIIINGGDTFVTRYCQETQNSNNLICAITQECVYTKINFDNNTFENQTDETTQYYIDYFQTLPDNINVILIEYTVSEKTKQSILKICENTNMEVYVSNTLNLN